MTEACTWTVWDRSSASRTYWGYSEAITAASSVITFPSFRSRTLKSITNRIFTVGLKPLPLVGIVIGILILRPSKRIPGLGLLSLGCLLDPRQGLFTFEGRCSLEMAV